MSNSAGFPRPRFRVPQFDLLVAVWHKSRALHEWEPGATDEEIAAVEESLGRSFPTEFRALYQMSNGLSLAHGNVQFVPLRESQAASENGFELVSYSEDLRKWGWPIPDEFLAFGNNGGGEVFGIWLPPGTTGASPRPVIMVGSIFDDPRCMAITGTSLCRFLTSWTAFYLQLLEAGPQVLNTLRVPATLRARSLLEVDEALFAGLYAWADPELPAHAGDPYEHALTADDLRARNGASPVG